MPHISDISRRPLTVGIECESLEGDHGGVARLTRKLIEQLAVRDDLKGQWRFILYFKRSVPAELPALDPDVFTTRVIGVFSFSLYYYLFLPLRLWIDKPGAMFWPNYMLPIIHPPHVRSVVVLTEDIYREAHNPKLPFRYRLAYRVFATGWAARFATRVLAISRSSRDALIREKIPAGRIVVNTLGVDLPPAGLVANPGEYLLYIGQAFPRRHLRETLAAFTELGVERPDLRLEVIGTDKYEPPFFETAMRLANRRLDRQAVSWRTHVDDEELAAAYAGARALIYVSDTEAFGLPPLEALAHGTPSVIADAPVGREVYGPHAFYVAEPTIPTIVQAMRNALDDTNARKRIKTATPSILARYTWHAHADRFLRIMRELLSRKNVK